MVIRRSLGLLFTLSVLGCSTQPKVYTDYDIRQSFAEYKAFTWVQNPPMLTEGSYPVPALFQKRMTAAIQSELTQKGFKFVNDVKDADFAVAYTVGARDKIEVRREFESFYIDRDAMGWGGFYYPHLVPMSTVQKVPSTYTKGSIAVDIFDAKSRSPVWHSNASKRLNANDLRKTGENATEVAAALLSGFPPQ